jgi:hypothetical protein
MKNVKVCKALVGKLETCYFGDIDLDEMIIIEFVVEERAVEFLNCLKLEFSEGTFLNTTTKLWFS